MAVKVIKDPELSMADKLADTTKARQNAAMRTAGVTRSDIAGNEHLLGSKHFGAATTPKPPGSKTVPQRDGLGSYAAGKAKGII